MTKKKLDVTDYQTFTTKNTSVEKRRKLNVGDIWNNSIKCLKCGEVIRSKNRHDMVWCKCKAVAVDGGSWYSKVSGNKEDFEWLTEAYNKLEAQEDPLTLY